MRRLVFLVLLLISILLRSLSIGSSQSYHFYNADDQPLPQYEWIYDELVKFFQDYVPEKIKIIPITGKVSRFDHQKERILIGDYALKNDPNGVVAHESCHLCMANYTKGASVREEFRFIDEGFAEIFQNIINDRREEYKSEALAVAAVQNLKSNISLAKAQKWSEYFGNPEMQTNFYAYPVGASFVFFLLDTYGMDEFFVFVKDLGQTVNLDETFQNVFQKKIPALEKEWLGYLSKVKVSNVQPRIVKMFPENSASNVSIKIEEIYLEFDLPMQKTIALITNCESGICYRNAYWKSDRILAVKVDLLPDYHYRIMIGNPSGNRLMSKVGVELPVTVWSFKTGSE
jgi:hypothetical protein